ncbi:GIY-YIG nuclease family protein [Nocardiopsis sp. NRRL B-16309]|uniref:GIY-YIG nuclease family protein n=1 Tax=Nocardiopsis sp. NRRL B-16309 TaxID=1519494 RepID=UPI0006AF7599|nr:GIY-YIG nuclease family protein [Nocardiopsis sp. NRRL B-16309]KOX10167.1 hypothetical protein ADL05_26200 [Nocardiopsis sp. NRRL B-16309]
MTDPFEPHAATLQHIELLADKRDRLTAAQIDAENQVIHRIAVEFHAGRINEQQLYRLWHRMRPNAAEKFGARWKAAMPKASINRLVTLHKLREQRAQEYERRYKPNADGFWSGAWPVDGDRWPDKGQCVVYVLYDADNVPCYVGSSKDFYTRACAHTRDGKKFVRWMAYPCEDRDAAYELESRLLREHKPYMNKRV